MRKEALARAAYHQNINIQYDLGREDINLQRISTTVVRTIRNFFCPFRAQRSINFLYFYSPNVSFIVTQSFKMVVYHLRYV